MNPELIPLLRCPGTGAPLHLTEAQYQQGRVRSGWLSVPSGQPRYPIEDFVPRFASGSNYADNFGMQWNRFRRTQLDSYSGQRISADRFFRSTGWSADAIRGQRMLDVGCGAGRFAEVALAGGARLVALDYSSAVDACFANLGHNPGIDAVQGDIYALPFAAEQFAYVYSLGVLQHTPDVPAAFAALPPMVRAGGQLCVDFYGRRFGTLLHSKYLLRPFTKHMSQRRLANMLESTVPALLAISQALGRVPALGGILKRAVPVANYADLYPLNRQQLHEWALLDTFDMLAPKYDKPQSAAAVRRWLEQAGLADIEVFRAGHLIGRGSQAAVIVGIDASNLRGGGGMTHLTELLRAADPLRNHFSKVILWSGARTLASVDSRPWLEKAHAQVLDGGFGRRALWQRFKLSGLARAAQCTVLFVPGGSFAGNFRPMVTMSRNLLPFEWRELRRFGLSAMTVKLLLLRLTQTRTVRHADGIAFLTAYAREVVTRIAGSLRGREAVIPHGIDAHFLHEPRAQLPISAYSAARPLRIVYVSIIDAYKHQWHVATAVAELRAGGLPVMLDLIGPARARPLRRLRRVLEHVDKAGEFIRYLGPVEHGRLAECYRGADLCVFASSCENMPNILLEGMASGLPIACSRCGPMPEVLGDAGVYFDPEDPRDIAQALRRLIEAPATRTALARAAFERAHGYSWRRCADETFAFLASVAAGGPGHPLNSESK